MDILTNSKAKKRKRTANFSADEKLKFVRLIEQMGQPIICKVTAHDLSSNTEKEQAWRDITNAHNSDGNIVRTTENLKKLWSKLKSEAKTFRSEGRQAVSGTGGGPATKYEDPVLELVVELTGRGSTGVLNVDDCDADYVGFLETYADIEEEITYYKDDFSVETTNVKDKLEKNNIEYEHNSPSKEEEELEIITDTNEGKEKPKENWAKRRQPKITNKHKRANFIKKQQERSNRFAAARLNAEKEKTNLILQQKQQNAELHRIKMENEQLKNKLLKILLIKQGAASDIEDLEVLSNL